MKRPLVVVLLLLVAGGAFAAYWWTRGASGLPRPGSAEYEQTVRAFSSGVAALQVGLLEDGARYFSEATSLAPGEPAAWGNLAVARLRLGDVDAAGVPVAEALRLAGDTASVRVLAARVETARGNIDAGIEHLRAAVRLDDRDVRLRFALAEELDRSGVPAQAAEALTHFDAAARLVPGNIAVLLERTRLAVAQQDQPRLMDSVMRLEAASARWSELARTQLQALRAAIDAGVQSQAARAVVLLRNALARDTAFGADLAAVRTPPEIIADTFDAFLRLPQPDARPAPSDTAIRFTAEELDARAAATATAFSLDGSAAPVVFAADAGSVWRVDGSGSGTTLPFPGRASSPPGRFSLLSLDWNNDFAPDLFAAGSDGVRLFVQKDGAFAETALPLAAAGGAAGAAVGGASVLCDCRAAWSADVEMDGDLDIVLGVREDATLVLRNNGDGSATVVRVFAQARDVRGFGWADLDNDGDPDAALLGTGGVRVFLNDRAGSFSSPDASLAGAVAMTVADLDADGRFDLVTSNADGSLHRSTWEGGRWRTASLVDAGTTTTADTVLLAADVDNNGALDVIHSGTSTRIWLAGERHDLEPLAAEHALGVTQVIDLDEDGQLDLLGVRDGVQRLRGQGDKGYHWKQIRVRAQAVAGDQRINPFAVGGEIDVRAGLLRQRQLLTGAPAHFGLGTRTAIDVARILWPNGVPQVEFALAADDAIVAEQRLKGSCPWVFAHDGTTVRFVTDFIWRSPLGLRVNAQDTAGVNQTEDWVRLRGDQLAPHDGRYDIRITAELWETHFFDHVSLLVVDHPADREMFIDERFTPQRPVAFAPQSVRDLAPVAHATNESGGDVTPLVAARDGRHLATFRRGHYQGVAQEHWVAFDLPERTPATAVQSGERSVLVAQGWVYPTDSSINLALGQGTRERPRSVTLDYQSADGRWHAAAPDLGFPAGKNKTMLIDLAPVGAARRVRLRTNMEVYWDALSVGIITPATIRAQRLPADTADLRYRGFSRTSSPRGDAPETPVYEPIATRGQLWRDLIGYYTRFGDVRELLERVDDRYVIMNAGDEMAMTFPVPPPPADGWTRDFVLIGDGWEKDGDYNTEHSATVLPLPSHAPAPGTPGPPQELERDPVFLRHRADWERYHTRHVRPDAFADGLGTAP